MSIKICHGIYDISSEMPYKYAGYYNDESREDLSMCYKFKCFLIKKGIKFFNRYGFTHFYFVYGKDVHNDIEVITICHPFFDDCDDELGEGITIGRIKRMRGDIKKIFYEKEEYEIQIKLYDIKDENDEVLKTIYKTITRKRVKNDLAGKPLIRRTTYFKPYDLSKKYPDIKHKDGTITYGELIYPYIHKGK